MRVIRDPEICPSFSRSIHRRGAFSLFGASLGVLLLTQQAVGQKLPKYHNPNGTLTDNLQEASDNWQKDAQFRGNASLGTIRADVAYAWGMTGKGIRIGIVDSGIDTSHPKFKKRFSEGYIHTLRTQGVYDSNGTSYDNKWESKETLPHKKGESFDVCRYTLKDVRKSEEYRKANDEHGTYVSGLIGAARGEDVVMQGVAFDSTIYMSNTGRTNKIHTGIDQDYNYFFHSYNNLARMDVRIINTGWGRPSIGELFFYFDQLKQSYSSFKLEDLRPAKKTWVLAIYNILNNILIGNILNGPRLQECTDDTYSYMGGLSSIKEPPTMVVITDNGDGSRRFAKDYASVRASLPYFLPKLESSWLAVGNLEGGRKNGETGNWCGVAKYWCVMAPGKHILSTVPLDWELIPQRDHPRDETPAPKGYVYMEGSSMAAPQVTGALALIMQRFPYMTNTEARDVLLTTAQPRDMQPGDNSRNPDCRLVEDPFPNAQSCADRPNAVWGWGVPDLDKAMKGPGQLLGRFDANLGYGASDTWCNDIIDKALEQRRKDDEAEKKFFDTKPSLAPIELSIKNFLGDKLRDNNNYLGSLNKLGKGTLTLTGNNTYRGGTVVKEGTLRVLGSIVSRITVKSGATLERTSAVPDSMIIAEPGSRIKIATPNADDLKACPKARLEAKL